MTEILTKKDTPIPNEDKKLKTKQLIIVTSTKMTTMHNETFIKLLTRTGNV